MKQIRLSLSRSLASELPAHDFLYGSHGPVLQFLPRCQALAVPQHEIDHPFGLVDTHHGLDPQSSEFDLSD